MKKKVVLAYSGGLDTSVSISWLRDKGYQVIAFIANIGQGNKNFNKLINRAKKAGAGKVIVKDLREEFITQYVFKALKAEAIYENKYYLATALSRPLIAKYLVDIAKKEKANAVAHGCSGKGNDQVRFEVSTKILNPDLEIIAPLRIWELKGRDDEIKYAKKKKIPIEVKKSNYSIDRNLWGASIECGILEELNQEPPEDVFLITSSLSKTPNKPSYVEIEFKNGIPVRLNGKKLNPVSLVEKLNKIGGKHGIGRIDMVENRLVGIKSREVYEAPAAKILYFAHDELESLILDRETYHYKKNISSKYAELIYYGLWYSFLKEALDKFIEYTQKELTGKIKLKLFKANIFVVSRESKYSKYNKNLATYSEEDTFEHKASEGFMKIFSLPFLKKNG
jgi:argininosuccinate synthase